MRLPFLQISVYTTPVERHTRTLKSFKMSKASIDYFKEVELLQQCMGNFLLVLLHAWKSFKIALR